MLVAVLPNGAAAEEEKGGDEGDDGGGGWESLDLFEKLEKHRKNL